MSSSIYFRNGDLFQGGGDRDYIPIGAIIGIDPDIANHGAFSGRFNSYGWQKCDGGASAPTSKYATIFSKTNVPSLNDQRLLTGYSTAGNGGSNQLVIPTTSLPAHIHTLSGASVSNLAVTITGETVDQWAWSGSAWVGPYGNQRSNVTHTTVNQGLASLSTAGAHQHTVYRGGGALGGTQYMLADSAATPFTVFGTPSQTNANMFPSLGDHSHSGSVYIEHAHNLIGTGSLTSGAISGSVSSSGDGLAFNIFGNSGGGPRYFNVVYFIRIN